MNGMALKCPACDRRWAVGTDVGEYERQTLEQAPCPHCGKHTLCCVAVLHHRGRKTGRHGGFTPVAAHS